MEYFKRRKFDFYLAGPMRGIPKLNEPMFTKVAAALRRSGYTVFNPSEVNDDDLSFHECMQVDLDAVVNKCQKVALLPGWRRSVGSNGEVFAACMCGKETFEIILEDDSDWIVLSPVDATRFKLPYRRIHQPVQLSKDDAKITK